LILDSRKQKAKYSEETADSRQQTANSKQQTTDSRQQMADLVCFLHLQLDSGVRLHLRNKACEIADHAFA
jgi:hypothetical protein